MDNDRINSAINQQKDALSQFLLCHVRLVLPAGLLHTASGRSQASHGQKLRQRSGRAWLLVDCLWQVSIKLHRKAAYTRSFHGCHETCIVSSGFPRITDTMFSGWGCGPLSMSGRLLSFVKVPGFKVGRSNIMWCYATQARFTRQPFHARLPAATK